jgi:hypothetical protein
VEARRAAGCTCVRERERERVKFCRERLGIEEGAQTSGDE